METNFPKIEKQILQRWRRIHAFEKSVEGRKRGARFVFYEGPPTANGNPGIHHVETRSFKDIICRYKTMRGFFVERKGGWDTHGLPVELQVEKQLGLRSKKDIERYGIAKFNKKCKESVWEYKKEWETLTERIGYWEDLEHPYITYETPYIETLWWIIKRWWDNKLFYRDYKVVPYCARCGTSLSSHEVAQGYKTVKEPSVYVKFRVSRGASPKKLPFEYTDKTYFLAWTTTPWTLPGNVGLAVRPDVEYIAAEKDGEQYILASSRASSVLGEYSVKKTFKGNDLVGLFYEPIFRFKEPESGKKVWQVVPADFVSTEDGTGIVHTAVAYGAEDFELGKKENLAMLHLVNEEGKFIEEVEPWKGMFVKDADPLIIEHLARTGALLKEELTEHEYPFCWRCSTPLLYYAKSSWFVNMQKVKKRLLANNERVRWYPSHIKHGRFGEWLADVKDWAFSRERYWGTPLPIWQCASCGRFELVGSVRDLAEKLKAKNTYYILRHGFSDRQISGLAASWPEKTLVALTPEGIRQAERAGRELSKKRIDMVFSSDLARTKQTAEIVGKELGLVPQYDKRLREFDTGAFNGRPVAEVAEFWHRDGETQPEHFLRRFTIRIPGGENWTDTQKRMVDVVGDLEKKYSGKTILLVSHELPLSLLEGTVAGLSREEIIARRKKDALETGEWKKINVSLLPRNEHMEVDLHRPYIDAVHFSCGSCEGMMTWVKEVCDVWFDSGAMPFAQGHWPFASHRDSRSVRNRATGALNAPALFPADYIVEAIDQTRGWFYTLLAVSTLLGYREPYKNVISLGHVLDEKGNKMSKSKGNVVRPQTMLEAYGADAVRWYFYTINQPWDSKLFSERDVEQVVRKFILTLWNSYVFWETYRPKDAPKSSNKKIKARSASRAKNLPVLDQWILSRLEGVGKEVAAKLDVFDVTAASRLLESFVVDDLSLWYIRRSRQRFQFPRTEEDRASASEILRSVLRETSVLLAPFIPFLAEYLFEHTARKKGVKESVHWADWPLYAKHKNDGSLQKQMARVRDLVTKALAERAKAGVKVRQPLEALSVKGKRLGLADEFLTVLKDEVNVKNVFFQPSLEKEVAFDMTITPELKREGLVRELLRNIQDMRKDAGYKPTHRIVLRYGGDNELAALMNQHKERIASLGGVKHFAEGEKGKEVFDREREIALDGRQLWIGIRKA